MPNPRNRHSSSRQAKRRTHYKAEVPALTTCSNCGATIAPHRVCPECGFYRGVLALDVETKVKK